MSSAPHRRYNPLLDEWLIVAPHRGSRPWQGSVEKKTSPTIAEFDPSNPLCPGGRRMDGTTTPEYDGTYVFDNDFPALLHGGTKSTDNIEDDLFKTQSISGHCKVMCFHPKSNVQLATMKHEHIVRVIRRWQEEHVKLAAEYDWVQIFENKGAIVGCSNNHPHCQIWASDFLPNQVATKECTQKAYFAKHASPMLLDYARREVEDGSRIVVNGAHFICVVPYWAVWPYETLLLPKNRQILRIDDLTPEEVDDLAIVMKNLLVKYDNLFECQFPYSMGWHGAPTGQFAVDNDVNHWQLHAVYLPPLLRSSTVKKFMAGYELVCEAQRDLTAEQAAEKLRNLSGTIHYAQN